MRVPVAQIGDATTAIAVKTFPFALLPLPVRFEAAVSVASKWPGPKDVGYHGVLVVPPAQQRAAGLPARPGSGLGQKIT